MGRLERAGRFWPAARSMDRGERIVQLYEKIRTRRAGERLAGCAARHARPTACCSRTSAWPCSLPSNAGEGYDSEKDVRMEAGDTWSLGATRSG